MPQLIGVFPGPGTSATMWLVMDITYLSQNVPGYYSTWSFHEYIYKTSSTGFPSRLTANGSWNGYVNGILVTSGGNNAYDFTGANQAAGSIDTLGSGNVNLQHYPSGLLTGIPASAAYSEPATQIIGNTSGSTSFDAPRILRAIRVKVAGVWQYAYLWVKVAGVWRNTLPWVKAGGVWKNPA